MIGHHYTQSNNTMRHELSYKQLGVKFLSVMNFDGNFLRKKESASVKNYS
jgi:hypothetical protein